jgi:hypothetical protein
MKYFRAVLALLGPVLLGGCLNSTTVINVKADGSGTIEQTLLMNKQAMAQLQQLTGAAGRGSAAKKGGPFDEQSLRSAASAMGDGVTFVSATPLNTDDAEGTRAVYAFTDITKLRLEQKPSSPGGTATPLGIPSGNSSDNLMFRFARSPAGNPRVTVVFPEAKLDAARKAAQAQQGQATPSGKAADPMQAAALAMMKPMLNGLKISILLQPAGKILKTNSPFVIGQQVTLLEMDLGQLLGDDTMLQKLQSAASLEEIKAALKDVKGAKINPDREVSVEFEGAKPSKPPMPLPLPKR